MVLMILFLLFLTWLNSAKLLELVVMTAVLVVIAGLIWGFQTWFVASVIAQFLTLSDPSEATYRVEKTTWLKHPWGESGEKEYTDYDIRKKK